MNFSWSLTTVAPHQPTIYHSGWSGLISPVFISNSPVGQMFCFGRNTAQGPKAVSCLVGSENAVSSLGTSAFLSWKPAFCRSDGEHVVCSACVDPALPKTFELHAASENDANHVARIPSDGSRIVPTLRVDILRPSIPMHHVHPCLFGCKSPPLRFKHCCWSQVLCSIYCCCAWPLVSQ